MRTVRRSPTISSGPTHVFKFAVCGKTFNKRSYDATMNPHKNVQTGYDCYGTYGIYQRTKY
jgi:hypothetical protein